MCNLKTEGGDPHADWLRSYGHNFHQNSLKSLKWHLAYLFFYKIFENPSVIQNFSKMGYQSILVWPSQIMSFTLWNFLKIYHFWPIWTIYALNESWNHFKLINGIEKRYFIENNCENCFFSRYLIWFFQERTRIKKFLSLRRNNGTILQKINHIMKKKIRSQKVIGKLHILTLDPKSSIIRNISNSKRFISSDCHRYKMSESSIIASVL